MCGPPPPPTKGRMGALCLGPEGGTQLENSGLRSHAQLFENQIRRKNGSPKAGQRKHWRKKPQAVRSKFPL